MDRWSSTQVMLTTLQTEQVITAIPHSTQYCSAICKLTKVEHFPYEEQLQTIEHFICPFKKLPFLEGCNGMEEGVGT